jgi:hypothetical protein
MASTLATLAESNADPFDANDWRWRWRLSSGLLLTLVDRPNDLYSDHAMRLVGSA